MKADMGGRAAKTRAAMDALDPASRVAMEGHRPGAYLRLRFSGNENRVQDGRSSFEAPCVAAHIGPFLPSRRL